MTTLVIVEICMVLILALGMVVAGWRGRRVDDHPICRKCRFDLHGIHPGSSLCPECGHSLSATRAIRRGNRRKRKRMIIFGSGVAMLCLAWLGLAVAATVMRVDWRKHAPTSFLMWQSRRTATAAGNAAADELAQRMVLGTLGRDDATTLINRAFAVQADATRTFGSWDSILQAAWDTGLFDQSQKEKYVRQGLPLQLLVRTEVCVGDRCPIRIWTDQRQWRMGRQMGLYAVLTAVEVNGVSMTPMGRRFPMESLASSSTRQIDFVAPIQVLGSATIRTTWHMAAHNGNRWQLPQGSTPAVEWELVLEGSFTGVPADATTVTYIVDDKRRESIRRALDLNKVTVYGGTTLLAYPALNSRNCPVDVAFTAFMREGGREWLMGTFSTSNFNFLMPSAGLDGFSANVVDVILRPSVEEAKTTPDLTSIWGEEIIFENVPVDWQVLNRDEPASSAPAVP